MRASIGESFAILIAISNTFTSHNDSWIAFHVCFYMQENMLSASDWKVRKSHIEINGCLL